MGVVCKWTNDSRQLLLEHFDAIHSSPSQIYHFALLFSPSSSWLQKCYSAEIPQKIRVVKGLPSEWGSCSHTISLGNALFSLSYWDNTIAVGCADSDIIIYDAITGSKMAILSGHTDWVTSITFSLDGRSLASGSYDKTVKLWDVQTGGVIKTFHGHSEYVCSVSISRDYSRVVSGSGDGIILLWDIQTGQHLQNIQQQSHVGYVCLSPTDPHYIISISAGKVWQWDINCQQISSSYDATSIAFSSDYSQLALCCGEVIVIRNSNSGEIITQFNTANGKTEHCCFSPDGKLIATAGGKIAYVWDITGPDWCLIETFVGHTSDIRVLAFFSPSSVISASSDNTIKFWQIDTSSKNQTVTDLESTPLTLSPIYSVSLQTTAGIAISSDRAGIVTTWDLSTGLCKVSFETPASIHGWRDVQFIGGRLIIIWYDDSQICIWDTSKNELLHTVDVPQMDLNGFRISGDGTKLFCLTGVSIQTWSIDTGNCLGEIELELGTLWYLDPFQADGSRIWFQCRDLSTQGWDFGISGSSPAKLPPGSTGRPVLDFVGGATWRTKNQSWIQDTVSGKKVFQLSGRYAKPSEIRWDGQYLVAGYSSGEILIVDFCNIYLQ